MSRSSTTTRDPPRNRLPPIHPGTVLAEELETLALSARGLAAALGVPPNRISAILKGERSLTADTALRLAHYLGTSAKFWMDLQQSYDLKRAEAAHGAAIRAKVKQRAA